MRDWSEIGSAGGASVDVASANNPVILGQLGLMMLRWRLRLITPPWLVTGRRGPGATGESGGDGGPRPSEAAHPVLPGAL
jgi:hypothetical protein